MHPSSQVPPSQVSGLCIGSCMQALWFLLLACFQGIKVLSPTITTCALQSYMPAQCPRYFLANATQIMVRCAWQSKHHIPR